MASSKSHSNSIPDNSNDSSITVRLGQLARQTTGSELSTIFDNTDKSVKLGYRVFEDYFFIGCVESDSDPFILVSGLEEKIDLTKLAQIVLGVSTSDDLSEKLHGQYNFSHGAWACRLVEDSEKLPTTLIPFSKKSSVIMSVKKLEKYYDLVTSKISGDILDKFKDEAFQLDRLCEDLVNGTLEGRNTLARFQPSYF
jgi:hypothetical protein